MTPVDTYRRLVYIATSNLYAVPPDYTECQLHKGIAAGGCGPEDNYVGIWLTLSTTYQSNLQI